MNPWSEAVWGWLADYYALATVVLLATVAALGLLRQPGRRLFGRPVGCRRAGGAGGPRRPSWLAPGELAQPARGRNRPDRPSSRPRGRTLRS